MSNHAAIARALRATADELDSQRSEAGEVAGEFRESLLEIKLMLTEVLVNQGRLSDDFETYKKSNNNELATLRRKMTNGKTELTQ